MSSYAILPNSRGDPDQIVYTATVINNNTSTAGVGPDPNAKFTETRDTPILRDVNDYELCVLKCSIDGGGKSLPILIPQIVTGTNIAKTIYTITLSVAFWNSTTSAVSYAQSKKVNILWVPENLDPGTPIPTTATPTQKDSPYYYLYTYNHFVGLVNTALLTAYGQVQAAAQTFAGQSGYTLLNACPQLQYDEVTKLFSFYTSTLGTAGLFDSSNPPAFTGLPTTTGQESMFIGYNYDFEGLFTNFEANYYGDNTVAWAGGALSGTSGTSSVLYFPENVLVVKNKSGTNIQNQINPATGAPYSTAVLNYVTTQDYNSTGSLWSPVSAIVLTTQLIPIRNEYTSSPVALGKSNVGQGTPGSSSFQTILLDFGEQLPYPEEFRGKLTFTPLAEFLPISMTTSHQEVKNVDFQVQWRNRLTNQLTPLPLYNLGSVSVRLLFRRKK